MNTIKYTKLILVIEPFRSKQYPTHLSMDVINLLPIKYDLTIKLIQNEQRNSLKK